VLTDWLQLASVWVLLYLFQRLTEYLPVKGFAGRLIEGIHQGGAVVVVCLLVVFLVNDVYRAHRAEGKQGGKSGPI
jgi:hypothetical protein